MKVTIFIEGAARSQKDCKYLQVRCREGFHKLLAKIGLTRQPALKACGGRGETYKLFKAAIGAATEGQFVAMLVDSEEPLADIEGTWIHLKGRDGWEKPDGASDEQVLLMTTCMESWIVTDRGALQKHYGAALRENALPPLHEMESRHRHAVQDASFKPRKTARTRTRKANARSKCWKP